MAASVAPKKSLTPIPPRKAKRLGSNDKSINIAMFGDDIVVRVKFAPARWMAKHGYLREEAARKLPCVKTDMLIQVIGIELDIEPSCWDDISTEDASFMSCQAQTLKRGEAWTSDDATSAFKEMGITDLGTFKADLQRLLFPDDE